MPMPALSERMKMNGELVPQGAAVADVGCDHGYVSMYLAWNRGCRKVIATDVNAGPLAIADKNIRKTGLDGQIECRLSDGLKEVRPGEIDTVLIAGMGGMLICRILEQSPEVLAEVDTLVIQAQSDWYTVRRQIWKLGYFIDEERFCRDGGKDYLVIRACRGKETVPYTEDECFFGRVLPARKDESYRQYLIREKEKREKLCVQLLQCGQERTEKRLQEIHQEIQGILRILGGYYGKGNMEK